VYVVLHSVMISGVQVHHSYIQF